jgi:2-dehydropantoate 2-reductase
MKKTRRIAVVGAGAVGSYYGGRLWEGANLHPDDDIPTTVSFHLRGENYDYCIQQGIHVSSYHGDFHIPAEKLSAYRTTKDMARSVLSDEDGQDYFFDWIICALKSTSLHEIPSLIEPLLSRKTRLLVIMNGFVEDDLINMMRTRHRETTGLDGLGCQAIYGGMALICSNRTSPGRISHSYGGKLVCGVAYSANAEREAGGDDGNGGWVESDKHAIEDLFQLASPAVPFEFEPCLRRGRWWKGVWNLPFSGIAVSMGGITVDRIVNDPGLRLLAYKVMDETIAIANADLRKHGCTDDELLGEQTKEEMMTLSDNMGPYQVSTMLDMHARKPMEVKYIFRKAVDRANELGVSCPYLESLVWHIEAHQRYHNLY